MRYWNVTGEGYHFNYSTNYTTKIYQHFNIEDCAGNGISVEGSSVKISRYVSNQILIRTEYNNLWTIHTLCSLHTKYLICGYVWYKSEQKDTWFEGYTAKHTSGYSGLCES